MIFRQDNSMLQPIINAMFAPFLIKRLLPEPFPPIIGAFIQVTCPVGWHNVSTKVLTTFAFCFYMIKRQVINWRLAAISAAVVPTIFD